MEKTGDKMAARIFQILADDTLLVNDKVEEIVKGMASDLEINYRNLKDDGLEAILGELSTPSFFGEKCIVIKDCDNLRKENKDLVGHLLKYLANPSDFNILVLVFADKDDIFNEVKKYSVFYELKVSKNSSDYLKDYFAKADVKISEEAFTYLLKYSEETLLLRKMADSLITYKIEEKEIALADIKALFLPPLENNVFELANAVIKHEPRRCFEIYQDLKLANIPTNYLLGLLIQKFQELYNTYILMRSGVNQVELANIYNIKPGRAYYMMQDAKQFSLGSIKKELKALNDLEYRFKTGEVDLEMAFSLYLLSL